MVSVRIDTRGSVLITPQKMATTVEVDPRDVKLRLREYYFAVGAELAGYKVDDLTLNIKLIVNGEEVFADFHLVVTGNHAEVQQIVLVQRDHKITYWYILEEVGGQEDLQPAQYRLFCEGSDNYDLAVADFAAEE